MLSIGWGERASSAGLDVTNPQRNTDSNIVVCFSPPDPLRFWLPDWVFFLPYAALVWCLALFISRETTRGRWWKVRALCDGVGTGICYTGESVMKDLQ